MGSGIFCGIGMTVYPEVGMVINIKGGMIVKFDGSYRIQESDTMHMAQPWQREHGFNDLMLDGLLQGDEK